MREIVFDTETTGLDWRDDRVIELGGIELVNRFPTGRSFHRYINPQGREINAEAQAVHGISKAELADKPSFADIAEEFIEFIDGAHLVAHNAGFDIAFINAEFGRLGHPSVEQSRVIDTLAIAKRKHPMGPNSLDALCRRYGIDNSRRTKHGALLDSELLAEVYIELIGGKQAALSLDAAASRTSSGTDVGAVEIAIRQRLAPLAPRITEAELTAHNLLVEALGEKAIWLKMGEDAAAA
ncbi:MAG TPA: DNA polymerase III subunit epsilon [Rhizobiaceae bacterium]